MREIDNKSAAPSAATGENALRQEALTEFHRLISGNLKKLDTDENRVISDKEFDKAIGSGQYAGKQLDFLKVAKKESFHLANQRVESFWLIDEEMSRMDVLDFGLATRSYIKDRQRASAAAAFLKGHFDAISGGGDLFLGELTSYRDKNPNLSAADKASVNYLVDHFADAGTRHRTQLGSHAYYGPRKIRAEQVDEYVSSVDSRYRTHSDVYSRIKDMK